MANNETRFPVYPELGAGPPPDEPRYHPNLTPVSRAETQSNLALNAAADRVGNLVSNAVERVREFSDELPDRLQDMKERFTVIRGRAQADIATKAGDVAAVVKTRARRTITRAEVLAREKPFQFIAGAAILGLVIGIALRIWRDHAD